MEVPRHWRLKRQRYGLVGEICPTCRSPLFPPRAVCPVCADQSKEEFYRTTDRSMMLRTDMSQEKIVR